MDLVEFDKIKDLLRKYSGNEINQEAKNELLYKIISDENKSLLSEILISELNEYDENQSNNEVVDFDHLLSNIINKIRYSESKRYVSQQLSKQRYLKRILLSTVSIAAVFTIAFFLGINRDKITKNSFSPNKAQLSYNEIKNPFGAKSEVILPDSSFIILNAGSILKYGNDFNSVHRNLTLKGEALFKVAKNADLPFIVNAGNISIKAIGTEFDVKAYDDEGIIETTLIKGSVEISKNDINNNYEKLLELLPNQKAIYIKESNQLTVNTIKEIDPSAVRTEAIRDNRILISKQVDVDQIVAWTKNKLIIKSERLEDLSIKLERKYDVKIIFGNNSIKSYRFSGELNDEPIEQVLDAIKLIAPIDFQINGKNVVMFSDKNGKDKL